MDGGAPIKFRRRNYFIKKGLQGSFVLSFSLAVLAGLFLNLLAAYFLIDRELAGELYRIHLKIRTTSEVAWPILWRLGAATVAVVLIVAAAIGWLLTKRVETLLRAFVDSVRKAAGGDLTERIEKKEGLENLPGAFNSVVASLGKDLAVIRGSVESAERLSNALRGALVEDVAASRSALQEPLRGLSNDAAMAAERISRFRV